MSASPGTSSNPFEVLGLDRSASFEDVKLAYRRLAREYHPDANPGDPTALERFTALRRAFDRLKTFYQDALAAGAEGGAAASGGTTPGGATPGGATPGEGRATPASGSAMGESMPQPAPGPAPAPAPASAPAPAPTSAPTPAPASVATGAPGAGSGTGERMSVPEPAVPGTGSRRAFHRSGPVHYSGDIYAGGSAAQPAQGGGAAPVRTQAPAPQVFGSGHLAARAEVIPGQPGVPAGTDPVMFYILVGLHASDSVVFPRIPLNLCLVLDHSSSMLRGGKVDRLKETVRDIIAQLDEEDFLSIVTFGDRAEVLLPAQPLRNKAMVQGAIDAIHCRGGTEISRGLTAGLSELARNASRALSHLILLTDGQTRGDEMVCLERAREAAAMSVGITAYGLGADWNNTLLDSIAAPTGGYSDYIESPQEMAQAFSARVTRLQATTLHKATLAIRPAEGHLLQRATLISPLLRPLEPSEAAGTQVCVLGDMSSNTDYRVLCELVLGPRDTGASTMTVATLTLSYDVPGLQREDETLTIPIAVPVVAGAGFGDPEPADPRVVEALRHMTIHRLQQQAWAELTTTGNLTRGTSLLKRAAAHLEVAGHADLARVTADEAARVEGGEDASDENIKRIIYGTRKLG